VVDVGKTIISSSLEIFGVDKECLRVFIFRLEFDNLHLSVFCYSEETIIYFNLTENILGFKIDVHLTGDTLILDGILFEDDQVSGWLEESTQIIQKVKDLFHGDVAEAPIDEYHGVWPFERSLLHLLQCFKLDLPNSSFKSCLMTDFFFEYFGSFNHLWSIVHHIDSMEELEEEIFRFSTGPTAEIQTGVIIEHIVIFEFIHPIK